MRDFSFIDSPQVGSPFEIVQDSSRAKKGVHCVQVGVVYYVLVTAPASNGLAYGLPYALGGRSIDGRAFQRT